MKTIDRRRLIGAILSGAGVGLVLAPGTLASMPIYSEVPDGLDDLVERAQVVVVGPRPRPLRVLAAAAGFAGGTGADAFAVGAGCRSRHH